MNTEEFEKLLRRSGLDLWTLIDTAISVAARDHGKELRLRRDGIVERLYRSKDGEEGAPRASSVESEEDEGIRSKAAEAEMDDLGHHERTRGTSPSSPLSPYRKEEEDEEEEEADPGRRPCDHPFEDEQSKILAIKQHLHDPDQVQLLSGMHQYRHLLCCHSRAYSPEHSVAVRRIPGSYAANSCRHGFNIQSSKGLSTPRTHPPPGAEGQEKKTQSTVSSDKFLCWIVGNRHRTACQRPAEAPFERSAEAGEAAR